MGRKVSCRSSTQGYNIHNEQKGCAAVVPGADAAANVLPAINAALATAATAAMIASVVVGQASTKAESGAAVECSSVASFQPGLLHCQQDKFAQFILALHGFIIIGILSISL